VERWETLQRQLRCRRHLPSTPKLLGPVRPLKQASHPILCTLLLLRRRLGHLPWHRRDSLLGYAKEELELPHLLLSRSPCQHRQALLRWSFRRHRPRRHTSCPSSNIRSNRITLSTRNSRSRNRSSHSSLSSTSCPLYQQRSMNENVRRPLTLPPSKPWLWRPLPRPHEAYTATTGAWRQLQLPPPQQWVLEAFQELEGVVLVRQLVTALQRTAVAVTCPRWEPGGVGWGRRTGSPLHQPTTMLPPTRDSTRPCWHNMVCRPRCNLGGLVVLALVL